MDFNTAVQRLIDRMKASENDVLNTLAMLPKVFVIVDTCEFDPVTFQYAGNVYLTYCTEPYAAQSMAREEAAKRSLRFDAFDVKCMNLTTEQMAGFIYANKCGVAYADGKQFRLVPTNIIRDMIKEINNG